MKNISPISPIEEIVPEPQPQKPASRPPAPENNRTTDSQGHSNSSMDTQEGQDNPVSLKETPVNVAYSQMKYGKPVRKPLGRKIVIILILIIIGCFWLLPSLYPLNEPLISFAKNRSHKSNRQLVEAVEKKFGELYINDFAEYGCDKEPGDNKSPWSKLECESYQYVALRVDADRADELLLELHDFLVSLRGFKPSPPGGGQYGSSKNRFYLDKSGYLFGERAILAGSIVSREEIIKCVELDNPLSTCGKTRNLPTNSASKYLNDDIPYLVSFRIINRYYEVDTIVCLDACPNPEWADR